MLLPLPLRTLVVVGALAGLLTLPTPVRADLFVAGSYGDVTVLSGGPNGEPAVVQLTSDTSPPYVGYAGIYWTAPASFNLNQLTTLMAQYEMTTGTFGGGAPRFSIIDTTNNANNEIYVFWGTPLGGGTFTDPNAGTWANTGNLADASSSDLRFQINGFGGDNLNPNAYYTYSQVLAAVGNVDVGYITIDLDGGFSGAQQMITDDFTVNDHVFDAQPPQGASVIPEPANVTLLSIGIAGMAGYTWRRRRRLAIA